MRSKNSLRVWRPSRVVFGCSNIGATSKRIVMRKALFLFLFLLPFASAEAQTVVNRYVNTDCVNNGDGTARTCAASPGAVGAYTSLGNADTDLEADYSSNLVAANVVVTVHLSGAAADTSNFDTGAGWTTDATRFITIRCDAGDPEGCGWSGAWSTSHYRLSSTGADGAIRLNAIGYARVIGLQIENTGGGTDRRSCISVTNAPAAPREFQFIGNHCRYRPSGAPTTSTINHGFAVAGNTIAVNNFIEGFTRSGISATTASSGQYLALANNTITNNGERGILVTAAGTTDTVRVRNNILSATGNDYELVNTADTYETGANLTADATSPDGASFQNKTPTYVNSGAADYRLDPSDTTARELGIDLSGWVGYAFTSDINGNTRPLNTSWDIGADEVLQAAPDFGCGRDTNRNGSVAALCSGADQDADGYTVAQGDCDDTRWEIFPGVSTAQGCTTGQWRTCKADGSGYTACSASTFCPNTADTRLYPDESAGGNCYYFNPVTGNNTTGDGSAGNPWQDLRKISSGFSGRYTPVAGDKFIVRGGTTSATFGTTNYLLLENGRDCTASQRCTIICDPRDNCVGDWTGNATVFSKFNMRGNYWNLRGFEITGGAGPGVNVNDGAVDVRTSLNYVHDHDGIASDNLAGIKYDQSAYGRAHHNRVEDICDVEDAEGCLDTNIWDIEIYRGVSTTVEYNILVNNTKQYGCIRSKHADYASVHVFRGNYCSNISLGGLFASRNLTVENNLISADQGLSYRDPGGTSYFGDAVYRNNTIIIPSTGTAGVALTPHRRWDASGNGQAADSAGTLPDGCSGDYFGPVTFSGNLIQSARTTLNQDQRLLSIGTYSPDSLRANWTTPGNWSMSGNCFYNTNGLTTLFGEFEANNGDLTCAGRGVNGGNYTLSTWQAAGFDTGSVVANPSLDTNTYLPAANCLSHGYRNNWVTVGANLSIGGSNSTGRTLFPIWNRRSR